MIQYLSQFTINDIIAVYCTGLLSIIFLLVSSGLIMMLIINLVNVAYDFIIKTQYEMKQTRRYYQEDAPMALKRANEANDLFERITNETDKSGYPTIDYDLHGEIIEWQDKFTTIQIVKEV